MKRPAGPVALREILRKASNDINAAGNTSLQNAEGTLLRSTADFWRADAEEAFELERLLYSLCLRQDKRPSPTPPLSQDAFAEPEKEDLPPLHTYTVRHGTSPLDSRSETVEAAYFRYDSNTLVFFKPDASMPDNLRPFYLLPMATLISITEA